MLKWRVIKDILIFLPAFHFILCFAYLFFYDAGFLGGIQNFSSPTDVFAVSFTALAPTYIASAFYLPVIFFYDNRIRKTFSRDPSNKKSRRVLYKAISTILAILGLVLIVSAIVLSVVLKIKYGFWPMFLISTLSGGLIFTAVATALHFMSQERPVRIIAFVVTTIVGALATTATGEAQMDRYLNYGELQKHNASCSSFVVLKPLGTHFLAVAPDESRIVINDECKPLSVLYQSRDFIQLPDKFVYRPLR